MRMDNIWILAQTDGNNTPSGIESMPVNSEGEAITTVPGDPNNGMSGRQKQRNPFPIWLFLPLIILMIFMKLVKLLKLVKPLKNLKFGRVRLIRIRFHWFH